MSSFSCLHPRKITTRRGEIRYVRCGKCAACTNNKSFSYTQQCQLESSAHRYNFFVTLTYDNYHIPLVRAIQTDDYTIFKPASARLNAHFALSPKTFFAISSNDEYVHKPELYASKFCLPESIHNLIPVLDKVDLQQFLKRLRYFLQKYKCNEKIRYFACGEYGPVHYRPHYHLQLWCDDPSTSRVLGKAIRSSWKFGRVDVQHSQGNSASYVAGYVNGISSRSRLHGVKGLRPFVLHSTHLFGEFYKNEMQSPLEVEYDEVSRASFAVSGRFKSVSPLLSFERAFFPRCVSYDTKCHSDRLACYCFADRLSQTFGDGFALDLVFDYLFSNPEHPLSLLLSSFTFDGNWNFNTFKSMYYTSVKFLRLCREYHASPDYYLRRIEHYYTRKDYNSLKSQYEDQQEQLETYGSSFLPFLLHYYDFYPTLSPLDGSLCYPSVVLNFLDSIGVEPQFYTQESFRLDVNPAFRDYYSFQRKLADEKVKHKKLNDLNKIFL